MGRSRRAGSAALLTDIVDGPWAGEEWKLSEVDMGVVGSMAMGLPWKGRGRGSVCWVKLVSGCWVLPWKGRGRGSVDRCSKEGVVGSCRGKEEAEDRSIRSDRSVGSCCGKEKAKNRPVGSCRGKDRCSEEGVLPWKGRGSML